MSPLPDTFAELASPSYLRRLARVLSHFRPVRIYDHEIDGL